MVENGSCSVSEKYITLPLKNKEKLVYGKDNIQHPR